MHNILFRQDHRKLRDAEVMAANTQLADTLHEQPENATHEAIIMI
jgi:hypothetical protein